MKIITPTEVEPICERIECPICKSHFEIYISDVYNVEYNADGKIGYINCPICHMKLKLRQKDCIDPTFKIYFGLDDVLAKHI